ncbi:MAG: ribosome maturation factor RimM [candidate division WOR-3 bacterium]
MGLITKPFGRWGEVRVKTSYPPSFFVNKRVYVLNSEYRVLNARKYKGELIVLKLSGVEDINQAELLRGLYLEVDESDLEPLKEGEFYVYQIIGCRVYDENYGYLGVVKDMHEWAPYWTLEVSGDREILIPFVSEFVSDVDIEKKEIKTRLPKGYVENL